MDEQLIISTPEQVAFEYEMAGIGSRFVAALLDHLILGTVLVLILLAISFVNFLSLFSADGDATPFIVSAILVLIFFAVFFGYFIVFETVWNGQTPGKRAGNLRVIRRNGQPIGAGEAMIRNLVRLVDFLPGFYGVGLVVMFIDKDARRLGDFAAGTIVVREGLQTRLRDVSVNQPAYAPSAYSPQQPPSYGQPPTYSALYAAGQAPGVQNPQPQFQPRPDPLPGISIREVTQQDYTLIRELLTRIQRRELAPERGQELAVRMAYALAQRIGQDFSQWQASGWQPTVFLQSLLDSRDARGE